jgi:hypothetical protein
MSIILVKLNKLKVYLPNKIVKIKAVGFSGVGPMLFAKQYQIS